MLAAVSQRSPSSGGRRLALHARMFIGFAAGTLGGVAAHAVVQRWPQNQDGLDALIEWVTYPVGQIFLRLLLMLVVPLVFAALALGAAGLGDLRRLGRVGLGTLAYTVAVSALAVLLGVMLVNALRPGEGV